MAHKQSGMGHTACGAVVVSYMKLLGKPQGKVAGVPAGKVKSTKSEQKEDGIIEDRNETKWRSYFETGPHAISNDTLHGHVQRNTREVM